MKVSTKNTNESVEVNFEDGGIGINKENMKKLFPPSSPLRLKAWA